MWKPTRTQENIIVLVCLPNKTSLISSNFNALYQAIRPFKIIKIQKLQENMLLHKKFLIMNHSNWLICPPKTWIVNAKIWKLVISYRLTTSCKDKLETASSSVRSDLLQQITHNCFQNSFYLRWTRPPTME